MPILQYMIHTYEVYVYVYIIVVQQVFVHSAYRFCIIYVKTYAQAYAHTTVQVYTRTHAHTP